MVNVSDDIGDDDPLPLAVAAKLFFKGAITKSSLRTEAAKGNLEIIRIANKDFVTARGIRKMIERWTVSNERQPPRKPPEEDRGMTAQEVLRRTLAARKAAPPTKKRSI